MDSEAEFAEFCEWAHGDLVAAFAHLTADRWLAEELAQESLIIAAGQWEKVSQLASPVGWCFRVGANKAASHFRRVRAEWRARARHASDEIAEPDDTAERLVVRAALSTLPVRARQLVVLRYFLGLTAEETGEVLGLSPGAVRTGCHRAVQSLRAQLRDAQQESHDAR